MASAPEDNLESCINSARYWTDKLPQELHKIALEARSFSVCATVISAITSVAVWPIISHSSELWAQFVTSGVAFLAAVFSSLPLVLDLSGRRRILLDVTQRMGPVYGSLLEARHQSHKEQNEAIAGFQSVWSKVMELALPIKSEDEKDAKPEVFRAPANAISRQD